MKLKIKSRLMSLILCFVFIIGISPMYVHADYYDGAYCDYCGSWRYDDWLCDGGDHCADGYGCGDEHHCQECGECESSSEWCEDCHMCVSCASENGTHCIECEVCGVDEALCEECGRCYANCGGECTEGQSHLCFECHLDYGYACENCGLCFLEDDSLKCLICNTCYQCSDNWCDECNMCVECAQDNGCHCPDCGACQVDSNLCEDCGRCYDCGGECSEGTEHLCLECHYENGLACPDCGFCFAEYEYAKCQICGLCAGCDSDFCENCLMGNECAMDNGTHCIECGVCNVDAKLCENCWRCYDCGGECSEGDEHDCLECHIENGDACPDCGTCFIDDYGVTCSECGVCSDCCTDWCDMCLMCYECATDQGLHCASCSECLETVDAYCEDCRICSDCSSGVCNSCGMCADCVEICPVCEEVCSSCVDICADCGLCEYCTDLYYCDVCNDYYCEDCRVLCTECNTCDACANICTECGNACSECSYICDDCGRCENCADLEYCTGCDEYYCADCRLICETCDMCNFCAPNCDCDSSNIIKKVNVTIQPPFDGRGCSVYPTILSDKYTLFDDDSVFWYDTTIGSQMWAGMPFVEGHQYTVEIWLKAADGYEFQTSGNNPDVKAVISNNRAKVDKAYEQAAYEAICISYNFGTCRTYITAVNLYDIEAPVAGAVPDYTVMDAYNSRYEIEHVRWTGPDGMLTENDTFKAGETYEIEIKIVPTKLEGIYQYAFESPLNVYLDTEHIEGDVYASSDKVYIYMSWVCSGKDPDITNPTDPEFTGLLGDADADGKVNIKDATAIQKHTAGLIVLTDTGAKFADVDQNSTVNVKDATAIQKHIAGIPTGFAIGETVVVSDLQ